MGHLFSQYKGEYREWSTGFTPFFTGYEKGPRALSVAVKCRLGSLEETEIVLLDTGAAWSVIDGETANILGDQLGSPTEYITMSTHLGSIEGALHRINITLLAEKGCGCDLTIDGTVLVSEQWRGPIVLGYRGFLERIRIALDPGVTQGEQIFYFGQGD